jgi:nicotinamidase-related amidase
MPITKLDTTAALIVIDLQKGIVSLRTVHPAGEIISRSDQASKTTVPSARLTQGST